MIDSGASRLGQDDALDEELKVAERGVGDVVGEMGVTIEAGGDVDEAKYDERERVVKSARPSKTPSGRSVIHDANASQEGARRHSAIRRRARIPRLPPPRRFCASSERGWARRGAEVRAVTRTRVTVMTNAQYWRMLAEDYGVDVERKRMPRSARRKPQSVRRSSLDAGAVVGSAVREEGDHRGADAARGISGGLRCGNAR